MDISTALDPGKVGYGVGIETVYQDLRDSISILPQKIMVIGQGTSAATYTTDKKQVLSDFEAGQAFGFGSPLHLAVRQLLPVRRQGVGNIPVILLPLPDGTTAAEGKITFADGPQTATKTYYCIVNEIKSKAIVVEKTTTAADTTLLFKTAIEAIIEMPVTVSLGSTTTELIFTAKWKGDSGNDLKISISGESAGITMTIEQPSGGAGNPDVSGALAKVGLQEWTTLFLNCLNYTDTTALDLYQEFGENRWLPLKPKPCIFISGNTVSAVQTACTISDNRTLDRINCQLVSPGSEELPFVVAARELFKIAVIAQSDPALDYLMQTADGIQPGIDEDQWNDTEREYAVTHGSSTIEVIDDQIRLGNIITFYHPTGEELPPYRFVVDIMKIMTMTYNVRKIFEGDNWLGKELIPNNQVTNNPNARKPSDAIAEIAAFLDQSGLAALISDPATAKKTIQAEISSGSNPKRLNVSFSYKLSGNANNISITQRWGFYFST